MNPDVENLTGLDVYAAQRLAALPHFQWLLCAYHTHSVFRFAPTLSASHVPIHTYSRCPCPSDELRSQATQHLGSKQARSKHQIGTLFANAKVRAAQRDGCVGGWVGGRVRRQTVIVKQQQRSRRTCLQGNDLQGGACVWTVARCSKYSQLGVESVHAGGCVILCMGH